MSEQRIVWRAHGASAAALAIFLGACGGGGDDGSPSARTPNTPPAGSAAITTDNAVTVMRGASQSMMAIHMLGGLGGGVVSGAASGRSDAPRTMAAEVAAETIRQLAASQNDPRVALTGMQTAPRALRTLDPVNCPDGGTITRSWDDVNNDNRVNSGDTFTFAFDNCVRGMMTRTGSIAVSNFTLTGDPVVNPTQPWRFTGELALRDVAVTGDEINSRANGTLALDWRVGTQMMEQATVRTVGPVTVVDESQTFTYTDFVATMNMDMSSSTMDTRMTADGKINVAGVGDLVLTTNTPMVMGMGGMQPTDGAVTVVMGRSRVTATTLSPTAVELRVDPNGDGTVIDTMNSSWDEIHAMPDMGSGGPGGTGGGGMMPRGPAS